LNQPSFGARPTRNAEYRNIPPAASTQYPKALRRGKAMSRAPTINGTKKLPKPDSTGMAKRNIIVMPCIEKIWLYVSGSRSLSSESASWARISSDWIPPSRRKTIPV
jgi:hypothetical protein